MKSWLKEKHLRLKKRRMSSLNRTKEECSSENNICFFFIEMEPIVWKERWLGQVFHVPVTKLGDKFNFSPNQFIIKLYLSTKALVEKGISEMTEICECGAFSSFVWLF